VNAVLSIVTLPIFIVLYLWTEITEFIIIMIMFQILCPMLMVPSLTINCILFYAQIGKRQLLLSLCSVLGVFALGIGLSLIPFPKFLLWGWTQYLSTGEDGDGTNLILIPLGGTVAVFVCFGLVLLAFLPLAAFLEEKIFRYNTKSWRNAMLRSLIFGLIHMLAGVPFLYCLSLLSLLGMWFSREYLYACNQFTRKYNKAAYSLRSYKGSCSSLVSHVGCTNTVLEPTEHYWKEEIQRVSKNVNPDGFVVTYYNTKTEREVSEKNKPFAVAMANYAMKHSARLHLTHNLMILSSVGILYLLGVE